MTTEVPTQLRIPDALGRKREVQLSTFAEAILQLNKLAAQRMTSRGWCYFIEGYNLITKGLFNKCQKAINECRKKGLIPIRFVLEDEKRHWKGVEVPETQTPKDYLRSWLVGARDAQEYYTPDWFEGFDYYIQMFVEKIDLVEMFAPICAEYHIPIVNSGGWWDISERAEAAERFQEAEERGLIPVALHFGDFDPWGLEISDFLHKGFQDIAAGTGWEPANLKVDRFGLNFDFIEAQHLTWIDNLESGSGKDMTLGKTGQTRVIRNWLAKYGKRKCEANAVMRTGAREPTIRLLRDTIEGYLGADALSRFEEKREEIRKQFSEFKQKTGLDKAIISAINEIDKEGSA